MNRLNRFMMMMRKQHDDTSSKKIVLSTSTMIIKSIYNISLNICIFVHLTEFVSHLHVRNSCIRYEHYSNMLRDEIT